MRTWLISGWSFVPHGTASGEPASTTDQKPGLESAGLNGQVESNHPSLPSFPEKVGWEPVDSRANCPVPSSKNEWAVNFTYAH